MINYKLKITSTDKDIIKEIYKAWTSVLQNKLSKVQSIVETKLARLITDAVENSKEYQSILEGDLRGHLGIENPEQALRDIIRTLINSIHVTIHIYSTPPKLALIKIEAIQADWNDILSLANSKYVSEKGRRIPWLEWMLLLGDIIIVNNFDVSFNSKFTNWSRTGQAIMIQSKDGWRVPPQYSGTIDNNFITRALKDILPNIEKVFIEEIVK